MDITQSFTFSVITPTQSSNYRIEWLEIQSPTGSFFVGPDHCPLVSILKPSSVIIYKLENAAQGEISVTSGIIKIENNVALALLD